MPDAKQEQKYEESRSQKISQFCVRVEKTYEALFKRYQEEFDLKRPEFGFLSEDCFTPYGEEECAPVIEDSFEGIARLYLMLQEEEYSERIQTLPYSIPKFKTPDQFCLDVGAVYESLFATFQQTLKLERPKLGFLSKTGISPQGEQACFPYVKEAYQGVVKIHLLLAEKYPEQASSHYGAIGLLNRAMKFAGYAFRYDADAKSFISLTRKEDHFVSKKTGKQRKKLSRNLEGFESKEEGVTKEFSRMLKTSARFFDVDRSRNAGAKKLSEDLQKGRQGIGANQTHHITGMSGRAIIAADAGALKHQLQGKDSNKLVTSEGISQNLAYKNKKGSKKQWFYAREAFVVDDFTLSEQIGPQAGHLGNFMLAGIGKYGVNKPGDVLATINAITGTYPESTKAQQELAAKNERQLAGILLSCAKKCMKITRESLVGAGISMRGIDQKVIDRLNRIGFLVNFKEISRRMHPGRMENGRHGNYDVEEVAFAMGHIRAMSLVAAGHLTMGQVFDKNAPYGLPTGTQLNQPYNIQKVKKKLEAINELYMEKMLSQEEQAEQKEFLAENPNGYVGFFREPIHQELRSGYAGKADTDNEEYLSSDEDTLSYRR